MPNRMNPQKSENTPKKTSHQNYENDKELVRGRRDERDEEEQSRSPGRSEKDRSNSKREDKPRKQ